MGKGQLQLVWIAVLAVLLGSPLAAQEARVRSASRVEMPVAVDSNSPAFWRDGKLLWFGSHGRPWLSEAANQFGPWETRNINLDMRYSWPTWLESVWPDDNGVLWGWYHAEPGELVPNSTLTAPKIGAVVSFDGGNTLNDLGFVLESGDPIDPTAQNGYFAGGHGDFSVILDRSREYFYFYFDNYGGPAATQGLCVARMAFADRFNPDGKVWKYYNGSWQEAGRGGRVTPIFPVKKSWMASEPDAFWGPSIHWNTYLNCYVMLLNHAQGDPGWSQEGVYVSFSTDITRPESWTQPQKIMDKSQFPGWYFFYPQVMGLESGGTDRRAGQVARLYVGGISKWEIEFVAAPVAPSTVSVGLSSPAAVPIGQTVILSALSDASGNVTYQWLKDGVAIPGATAATYDVAMINAAAAGVYSVGVANPYGAKTSSGVAVSLATPPVSPVVIAPPPPEAFLSNLSVRSVLTSDQATLSVGFVLQSAAPKSLALRAIGPSLAAFGVENGVPDPRLEVFDASSVKTAENDNWLAADAGGFAALGAFPLPVGSADAGLMVDLPAGPGTAVVRGNAGGVALVEIYDPAATTDSKIVNLSARAMVGSGDQVLIGGLSLTGSGTKRLLIRAMGPQLEAFGVGDALADPAVEVYENGVKVAENDDWSAELAPTFGAVGAAALMPGSRDSAVIVTATAGNSYTVIVRSNSGASGEALLEIFEAP